MVQINNLETIAMFVSCSAACVLVIGLILAIIIGVNRELDTLDPERWDE